MKILVTGGLGFIGSHTIVELVKNGYEVVIVDDLSNSDKDTLNVLERIVGCSLPFYQMNICDKGTLEKIFEDHTFDGVIHFAAYKAVAESVEKPLMYYQNNLIGTLNIIEMCQQYHVKKIVFSSSATVYGDSPSPMKEDMPLKETSNPYGETKAMVERILTDISKSDDKMCISLLRYFNPIGAHESGFIGENPKGIPNNLMPYILKVASGEYEKLTVYGDDYDTVDGSGVRDYIHVVDLAKGHVAALANIKLGTNIYNLGTGKGTSVFEIIEAFERVNKVKIPYVISARRAGDNATSFASPLKAKEELSWQAYKSIDDMVKDSWRYISSSKV